jgi:hypothetical protein
MRDFFDAFRADPSAPQYVGEEGADVIASLGTAE